MKTKIPTWVAEKSPNSPSLLTWLAIWNFLTLEPRGPHHIETKEISSLIREFKADLKDGFPIKISKHIKVEPEDLEQIDWKWIKENLKIQATDWNLSI